MLIKDHIKINFITGLAYSTLGAVHVHVFFGILSLDRNISIAISMLLLNVIIGLHGVMQSFNKNYYSLTSGIMLVCEVLLTQLLLM